MARGGVTVSTAGRDTLEAALAAALEENRRLQEKLTAALDGTGLCIWQGDIPSGKLTVFNLQDFQFGDMAPDFGAWVNKLHPDDRERALNSYHDHLAGATDCYEAEYRTLQPDGGVTWLWDRGRVIERDGTGRPLRVMGAHVDITRRKEHEALLARLAHYDPLTGLPNRRLLLSRLKREVEQDGGGPLVLAMLDIDHFKSFNDRHGHDVGDQVLIEVAQAISAQLRRNDLCGRWGGEEFLLLLSGVSQAEAERIIRRVHQALRQLSPGDAAAQVSASIGVAVHLAGESFSQTIKRADAALLRAKREGRDRICLA